MLVGTASGKSEPEDLTDFRVRKDIVDRIKHSRLTRVVIIGRDSYGLNKDEMNTVLKTVEFFVFAYNTIAVSSHHNKNVFEEVEGTLPGNLKRRENMLMVDNDPTLAEELDIDYINLNDFLA